jgi:hypothetical protein
VIDAYSALLLTVQYINTLHYTQWQDIKIKVRNKTLLTLCRSWGISVDIAIRLRAVWPGSFSLLHSVKISSGGPPSLLPDGYWGMFPRGWGGSGRCVKLTTHLHVVAKSRMVELYLHYPTCLHGTVKYRDNFKLSWVSGQISSTGVSRSGNTLSLIPGDNYERMIIAGLMIGKGKLKYSAKCLRERHFVHVNSHAERAQPSGEKPVSILIKEGSKLISCRFMSIAVLMFKQTVTT